MSHLKGLEAHTRVFDASDHTLGHGEVKTSKNDKGEEIVVAEGKDYRFDKYSEVQEKARLDVVAKQAKEIEALKKELAKLQKK